MKSKLCLLLVLVVVLLTGCQQVPVNPTNTPVFPRLNLGGILQNPMGNPMLFAAVIIGGILALTKLAKVDLRFIIPFVSKALEFLLSPPTPPSATVEAKLDELINIAKTKT